MRKTQLIGEFKQLDGWHVARVFDTTKEARDWVSRVDESGGHHHARRFRRVRTSSQAWDLAMDLTIDENNDPR